MKLRTGITPTSRYAKIFNPQYSQNLNNPHIICLKSSGTPYLLFCTQINDTNLAYSEFIGTYSNFFNKNFPLKKVSRSRDKNKKWITKGLRISIKTKNKLLKKKYGNPSNENITRYNEYNKILQKSLFKAENMYYNDILSNRHESNSRFWKLFGNIISPHKQKKHTTIDKVLQGDQMITDPKSISEAFNNHFVSIGKKLTDQFITNDDFSCYMRQNCINSIFLETVTADEILKNDDQ